MKILNQKEKIAIERAHNEFLVRLKLETTTHTTEDSFHDEDGYYLTHLIEYIRISELPEKEQEEFEEWMNGQTRPIIKKEIYPKGKLKKFIYRIFGMTKFVELYDCAYYWDYEKWAFSKHFQTTLNVD